MDRGERKRKTLAGTHPTFGFTTLPLGSFGFEGRLYVNTNKTKFHLSLSLSVVETIVATN